MANSILKASYLRAKAVWYLEQQLGKPYVWGGDDPLWGFDCSGVVINELDF